MMKKALKILLILMGVLILAFSVTGLIVDQTLPYTTSITIHKPVHEVFEKFSNLDLLKEWVPEIKSIKTIKETPNKVGSIYEMEVDNKGRGILVMTEEIKEYTQNKSTTLFFNANVMQKTDAYQFLEKKG